MVVSVNAPREMKKDGSLRDLEPQHYARGNGAFRVCFRYKCTFCVCNSMHIETNYAITIQKLKDGSFNFEKKKWSFV